MSTAKRTYENKRSYLLYFGICQFFLESNQPLIIPINTCLDKKANKESIEFCFDQLLEDSRCPINAVCVWQGVAKAKFSLKINGETKTFELSTLNMPPYYRTDTTLNGYKNKTDEYISSCGRNRQ
jgi:hypothetical protein